MLWILADFSPGSPALFVLVLLLVTVGVVGLGYWGTDDRREGPAPGTATASPLPDPYRAIAGPGEAGSLRQTVVGAALASVPEADTAQLWEADDRGRLVMAAVAGRAPGRRAVVLEDGAVGGDLALRRRLVTAMGVQSAMFEPVEAGDERLRLIAVGSRHTVLGGEDTGLGLLAQHLGGQLRRDEITQVQVDETTGLPNARSLDAALRRELARASRSGEPLALAILEAPGLSSADPAALRIALASWGTLLRETDLVARTGDDELVILLPSCPITRATEVLTRLRARMPLGLPTSVGASTLVRGETAAALLGRARGALGEARARSAGLVVRDPRDDRRRFVRDAPLGPPPPKPLFSTRR